MTTNTLDDLPTVGERYLRASVTSDLGVKLDRACDADMMLAAGYAAAAQCRDGDATGTLALALWRMRVTGDMSAFQSIREEATNRLVRQMRRPGRDKLPPMARVQAFDLTKLVMLWWLNKTCGVCEGRGHPLAPGSNRVNEARDCVGCNGRGESQVERAVNNAHREHARWMAGEFDGMAGAIFRDMARLLRPSLDL